MRLRSHYNDQAAGCTSEKSYFDSWQGKQFISFAKHPRSILEPTQVPAEWAVRALSPAVKRPVREANHSPHLVPRLRMGGATDLTTMLSWREQIHIYFFTLSRVAEVFQIFRRTLTPQAPQW
jgi:hypothetical protein